MVLRHVVSVFALAAVLLTTGCCHWRRCCRPEPCCTPCCKPACGDAAFYPHGPMVTPAPPLK